MAAGSPPQEDHHADRRLIVRGASLAMAGFLIRPLSRVPFLFIVGPAPGAAAFVAASCAAADLGRKGGGGGALPRLISWTRRPRPRESFRHRDAEEQLSGRLFALVTAIVRVCWRAAKAGGLGISKLG